MRTTDAYVIFRNKPPYPRLRLTVLETGQSVEMTNSHRNGYGRSNDAPFTFGFSANTHIKLEFLS